MIIFHAINVGSYDTNYLIQLTLPADKIKLLVKIENTNMHGVTSVS